MANFSYLLKPCLTTKQCQNVQTSMCPQKSANKNSKKMGGRGGVKGSVKANQVVFNRTPCFYPKPFVNPFCTLFCERLSLSLSRTSTHCSNFNLFCERLANPTHFQDDHVLRGDRFQRNPFQLSKDKRY